MWYFNVPESSCFEMEISGYYSCRKYNVSVQCIISDVYWFWDMKNQFFVIDEVYCSNCGYFEILDSILSHWYIRITLQSNWMVNHDKFFNNSSAISSLSSMSTSIALSWSRVICTLGNSVATPFSTVLDTDCCNIVHHARRYFIPLQI